MKHVISLRIANCQFAQMTVSYTVSRAESKLIRWASLLVTSNRQEQADCVSPDELSSVVVLPVTNLWRGEQLKTWRCMNPHRIIWDFEVFFCRLRPEQPSDDSDVCRYRSLSLRTYCCKHRVCWKVRSSPVMFHGGCVMNEVCVVTVDAAAHTHKHISNILPCSHGNAAARIGSLA